MTTHAMIDLETLDVLPTAVVLTIGGVKFDPNSVKETTQHFYYRFNVDEQLSKGRTTSKSTLDWWSTQEQSVVDEALGDHDRTPVLSVLQKLNKWCVGVDTIWCQGPAFDIVILEDMFRQYDHHLPWPFWKIKDSRTYWITYCTNTFIIGIEMHLMGMAMWSTMCPPFNNFCSFNFWKFN